MYIGLGPVPDEVSVPLVGLIHGPADADAGQAMDVRAVDQAWADSRHVLITVLV